jgi:hypothetical protein
MIERLTEVRAGGVGGIGMGSSSAADYPEEFRVFDPKLMGGSNSSPKEWGEEAHSLN